MDGELWVEVLRRSTNNPRAAPGGGGGGFESDDTGIWYLSAPGSGMWLSMGRRVLDFTCLPQLMPQYDHPPYKLHNLSLNIVAPRHVRVSCGRPAAGGIPGGNAEACVPTGCVQGRSRQNCNPSEAWRLPCAYSASFLKSPGVTFGGGIPSTANGFAKARALHGFDVVISWWNRDTLGWQLGGVRQITDVRAHGLREADYRGADGKPHGHACGGNGRARLAHLRAGCEASGADCSSCDEADWFLNCGPRRAPHAAQMAARRAYRAKPACPDAHIRWRCLGTGGGEGNLTATSPAEVMKLASNQSLGCERAFMWWPPRGCR